MVKLMETQNMANYEQWNEGILSYFIEGVQRGTSIFLSIDEDVLIQIAHNLGVAIELAVRDFCRAVHRCIVDGERVILFRVSGRTATGEPRCVAFLAAMVLAASRMVEGDLTSHSNYFRHLHDVLMLPTGDGRPRGMDTGIEETLWQEFSLWLQEKGFLPSAYPGPEGATKFINYPISQALLRLTDKDRLRKLFVEKHWPYNWDEEMLLMYVRREISSLSLHLRQLLDSHGQRYYAVAESIYEFYETWKRSLPFEKNSTEVSRITHLSIGLYRTEDYFRGDIKYYLYPRSPRRHHVEQLSLWFSGNLHTLRSERPGWYYPIGPIHGEELTQGLQYEIEQPADFDTFLLPQRQFWILTHDPDNPDSDAYASWGLPSLGIPFIILCRRELLSQLEYLRDERLIEWHDVPHPVLANEQWMEIHQCMIILEEWSGVRIENQQLHDALRPKQSLNISASGGLRTPKLGGWIEGYGPQITVFSFESQADVRVVRVANNSTLVEQSIPTNQSFSVTWTTSGDYRVEASCKGERVTRLVKIVPWSTLSIASMEHKESYNVGQIEVCGANIEERA